jgi:formylglycine-generating enzyme required for sulfatase activity
MKATCEMVGLAALLAACSVRFAGPADLVNPITKDAGAPIADADVGGTNIPRLSVKCSAFTKPAASIAVSVAAGAFTMGCDPANGSACRDDEKPAHTVTLAAFAIDATEVTQAQYYECARAGACRQPACDFEPCDDQKRAKFPVVCVDRVDAEAYCHFRGARLPSEAEWEKAARGGDERIYPWGDDPLDCDHANMAGCPTNGTLPVGSLAKGASSFGALDMAGNVVEWVEDAYDPGFYAMSPTNDPTGPRGGTRFGGRGGGWRSTAEWQRTTQRDVYEPEYLKDSLGFRCASSTPAPT